MGLVRGFLSDALVHLGFDGTGLSPASVTRMAFYDFPAEHWGRLRTSNPIESTFATVRLRNYRTKGPGSRKAEKGWRKLNASAKLQDLIDGIMFVDGERKAA